MFKSITKNAVVIIATALFFGTCAQKTKDVSSEDKTITEIKVSIDHYAINVENLNRSVDFYQKLFGLKEITNGTELRHIKWLRLGSSQELHIIEVENLDKKLPKGVHIALAVSDFDRFRENLDNLKIPYSDWLGKPNAVSTRPDTIRQLYLQDLDGYWVEVNDGKQF